MTFSSIYGWPRVCGYIAGAFPFWQVIAGTIPATEQGQEQNQSVLVDASQIRLSDMGSMDGGMGGFDRKNPPGGKKEKYEEGNKEVDDRWFPKR